MKDKKLNKRITSDDACFALDELIRHIQSGTLDSQTENAVFVVVDSFLKESRRRGNL